MQLYVIGGNDAGRFINQRMSGIDQQQHNFDAPARQISQLARLNQTDMTGAFGKMHKTDIISPIFDRSLNRFRRFSNHRF